MLKKNFVICGMITFLLCGCNNNSSSSNTLNNSKFSSSIISDNSSKKTSEATILIEYYFKDGKYLGKNEEVGKIGEKYKYTSPTYDFMEPDFKELELELTKDGYYKKIVYDYSYEVINDVENGKDFSSFMADKNKGISINYTISGSSSSFDELFTNEYFTICNGNFIIKDLDYDIKFTSEDCVFSNNMDNGVFLTNKDEEIYVNISINPDKSISMYKNGNLAYTWVSSMRPSVDSDSNIKSKNIGNLVDNIFEGVSNTGFTIGEGKYQMKDLFIGYSLSSEEVLRLYNKKIHTEVKYIDEFGNKIFDSKSIIDDGGTEFFYNSPEKEYYICDKKNVSGITKEDKIEYVTYNFTGEEKISLETKKNKENIFDRSNTYNWSGQEWFKIVENIQNDFIIRINYNLKGSTSIFTTQNGGSCSWRTNLTIIENPENKDRFVTRLDWYGWQDDVNGDGINIGSSPSYGECYLDDYNLDIFNVYSDCDITQTIQREGSIIKMNYIIIPNKAGYNNKVYYYNVSISNVVIDKINISFAAEDAIVSFNSIKVLNL